MVASCGHGELVQEALDREAEDVRARRTPGAAGRRPEELGLLHAEILDQATREDTLPELAAAQMGGEGSHTIINTEQLHELGGLLSRLAAADA